MFITLIQINLELNPVSFIERAILHCSILRYEKEMESYFLKVISVVIRYEIEKVITVTIIINS